jgi:DNA-binding transcriptional LysR family regulator
MCEQAGSALRFMDGRDAAPRQPVDHGRISPVDALNYNRHRESLHHDRWTARFSSANPKLGRAINFGYRIIMIADPFELNLRHLRAMTEVVRCRSLSAAADVVGITQPALTAAISGLELKLAPLFTRSRDGMVANDACRKLAARVMEAYGHLAAGLRGAGRRTSGFSMPERLLTTSQLRALLALADEGSFVAAAQATRLSQPALHRSVRDVERLVGTPLVQRRGRGVTLTRAGHRAARGFRLALGALRSGISELALEAGPIAADGITIGAMPLCRARLLPGAIADLHAGYPDAHVTVIEGAHRELMDQLREGRIDMAIGALRSPSPGPDLVQEPLLVDRLAIVGRGRHPLAGAAMPSLDQLASCRWLIGLPGSPLRAHWERLFATTRLPVAPVDCGSVMVIRSLLLSGDYLTLLSPEQIGMELETGMLELIGPPLSDHVRTIGFTVRADWKPTPGQDAFIKALKKEGATIKEN